MKKFIYGFTILLGIGLISTNFIINDTSNIDHKTVKAGGTVCRWIGESGYGTGPVYYDDSASGERGRERLINGLKLFKCDTSTSSHVYDSKKIYTKTGELLNAKIYGDANSCLQKSYISIVDGLATQSYEPTSYTPSSDSCKNWTTDTLNNTSFTVLPVYGINGSSKNPVTFETLGIDVGNYTCVCAEY